MISDENWSSCFREEDIYEIYYMYIAQGQGQITLGDKILKGFATLRIHCKFQPLVLNTFFEKLNFQYFPIQMHRDANLTLL